MKRKSTIFAIALTIAVAAFTYWMVATPAAIPNPIAMVSPSDIASIERGTGIDQKTMVRIPESKYGDIIKTLGGATNELNPWKWQVTDQIIITHSDGHTTKLTFFDTKNDYRAFKTGKYYFRFDGDIPFKSRLNGDAGQENDKLKPRT